MRKLLLAATAALVGLLAGCAQPNINPTVYDGSGAMQQMSVQYATVEQVNAVAVTGTGASTGGSAGMVLGALAGSLLGQGRGSTAMAIVGGIAGAIGGSHVGASMTQRTAQQIVYRIDNGPGQGQTRALVQGADPSNPIQPGCKVMVVMQGYTAARLVRVN